MGSNDFAGTAIQGPRPLGGLSNHDKALIFTFLSSIPISYTSPETLKPPKMATLSSHFTVGGITNEAHQIALLILTSILSNSASWELTKMSMIETDYFKGI